MKIEFLLPFFVILVLMSQVCWLLYSLKKEQAVCAKFRKRNMCVRNLALRMLETPELEMQAHAAAKLIEEGLEGFSPPTNLPARVNHLHQNNRLETEAP